MTFSDVFAVIKELILDWRLIVAFVGVFLYLKFVFYVSKYKKKQDVKPKRFIRKKTPAEAAPSGAEAAQGAEATSEAPSEDEALV